MTVILGKGMYPQGTSDLRLIYWKEVLSCSHRGHIEMLCYLPVPNSPAEGVLENTAVPPLYSHSPLPSIPPWGLFSPLSTLCEMMEV